MTPLRALLVGIDAYPRAPLRGAKNDAARMRSFLQDRYDLPKDQLRTLEDAAATRDAILEGLRWLLAPFEGGERGVKLFHFSGHGSWKVDEDGDEPDGRDECLVPVDHETAGFLLDDELGGLFQTSPPSDRVVLVVDACCSGTIQKIEERDIVNRFLPIDKEVEREEVRRAGRAQERVEQRIDREIGTEMLLGYAEEDAKRIVRGRYPKLAFQIQPADGNVVLLAACRAEETAADARFGETYHGAFTYHLLEEVEGGPRTYEELIAGVGQRLKSERFSQTPQLECDPSDRSSPFLGLPPL